MTSTISNITHTDLSVQLLTDVQSYFAKQTAESVPTEQLLDYLNGIDHAPWATLNQGKTITARHLAQLLKPYGIKSKNLWQAGAVAKGYRVADFKEAFAKVVADVADKPSGIADNLADKVQAKSSRQSQREATRNQLYRLGETLTDGYEATGNPFSHADESEIQQWRDLVDLMRQAADSIESFTVIPRPALTLIQGNARGLAHRRKTA